MDRFWIFILVLWNSSAAFAGPETERDETSLPTLNEKPGELSKRKCLKYSPLVPIPVIAGGTVSLPKEFAHMAAIGYGGAEDIQWSCGGSLISKKFVLTAAHCLKTKIGYPKFVRLGDLDLSSEEEDAEVQNFTVVRRIPHPSYKYPIKYHDIGLLELDREVNFSEYVFPACLYTEEEFNTTKLTAIGWGKTDFNGGRSNTLLKVDLDYVPHDTCAKAFEKYSDEKLPKGIIKDFQLCAGGVKGHDTCQGDSGGPLQKKYEEVSFTKNVHKIIGITSFGKPCALLGIPGVYTRVSYYIPWIESIVWENEI